MFCLARHGYNGAARMQELTMSMPAGCESRYAECARTCSIAFERHSCYLYICVANRTYGPVPAVMGIARCSGHSDALHRHHRFGNRREDVHSSATLVPNAAIADFVGCAEIRYVTSIIGKANQSRRWEVEGKAGAAAPLFAPVLPTGVLRFR